MKQVKTLSIPLMRGWKFCCDDVKRWTRVDHDVCYTTTKIGYEVGTMEVFLKENDWQDVTLPHDWNTHQLAAPENHPSNGFKPRGIGWYYNEFDMPDCEPDACVLLEFEGVMGECVVYVNGVLAARNESGYTGFTFDISDYVLPGQKNMIVVSVDNRRWEGWWYEGAGIYRPVCLHIKPPVHLAHMKTFVRPQLKAGAWQVCLSSEIKNTGDVSQSATLNSRILDQQGRCVARLLAAGEVAAFGQTTCTALTEIEQPELWSPDRPYLYTLENHLMVDGQCVETERIRFGLRDIQWTDHGMFVNGVLTPVRGICCHQDHVGVGIAVNQSLTRYRIAKLKAMGCNAYRCAHYCPDRYLLEVCDELGMLVMAENRHFRSSDEVMQQLDYLVLLSRNHPSVFLYSLFNEEMPWQSERRGRKVAARMLRRVRINDDTRPVTAAMNGGVLTKENASDVLDVGGMNYFIDDYMNYAKRRPGHPLVGTENGPLYATRGIYADDPEKQLFNAYGLTTAPFGQRLQETMEAVEAAPHVAGLFVWGGFDYRGEPQPFEWPSVFSHWGLTDNCGFEKDTFYMLKSYYSDPDELMVHLLPHWNWKDGDMVRVCVMTNCDTAQLFVNAQPQTIKTVVRRRAEWEIPYVPGVIRVEAVKGDVKLTDEVRTAGSPARIELVDAAPDQDYDASILNVQLKDAGGIDVPGTENDRMIHFEVIRGELIGTGNGDPNGIQPDITPDILTFCGRCQAIVRPDAQGQVQVKITCAGMPPVEYVR